MERKQGKQYIIYKWSHAKNWKPKRKIRVKNILRKQCVSKQSTEPYKYKIAKVLLCPWAENQQISDTKGHYG